jgi:hypothetical protein
MWIRTDAGIADNVQNDCAPTFAGRRSERAHQCFGKTEWTKKIGGEHFFEVFTFGVGKQSEWCWTKTRGVVDKNIEAAELACDLDRHRVDVFLFRDIGHDPVRVGIFPRDLFDSFASPCNKGDSRASADQFTNKCEAQTRSPTGYSDSQSRYRIVRNSR